MTVIIILIVLMIFQREVQHTVRCFIQGMIIYDSQVSRSMSWQGCRFIKMLAFIDHTWVKRCTSLLVLVVWMGNQGRQCHGDFLTRLSMITVISALKGSIEKRYFECIFTDICIFTASQLAHQVCL